jgi:uncharacterized iron-regulated membrane protein
MKKVWRQWLHQPNTTVFRRALFQVHAWSGIGLAAYVFVLCVSGSALVYRGEMFRMASQPPRVFEGSGEQLADGELRRLAEAVHPGFRVSALTRARNPKHAVFVRLRNDTGEVQRLFDPFTGIDVGPAVSPAIRFISWLSSLHDNLLSGPTGKAVNGFGGFLLMLLAVTGAIVWWPGVRKWRYNLAVHRHVGWRRFTWELHGAVGFWSIGFILLFGATGAFLGLQTEMSALADLIEPPTDENIETRVVDGVMYWLAYLHFGRFGGRFSGCGPTCNATFKAVWALSGLAAAVLAVTGAMMWWNRVIRRSVIVRPRKA